MSDTEIQGGALAEPAGPGLRTVFGAEGDWRRAETEVTQAGDAAHLVLAGDGDLDAAAAEACRFLALDVGCYRSKARALPTSSVAITIFPPVNVV